ncbi:MAG TPA: hypothetical protein VKA25_12230 [Gemmatimonadales bacterium]|nr:hypothetical protein [Gemmatimonadales bacterium]
MSASRPIQEPITGEEDLGDLTRPEEALAQFYRALNSRDLALLEQNWDTSYEAAMDNPLSGIMRGSPLVAPEHRHIFRAFVRRAFDEHGNSVDKTLRPFFTKPHSAASQQTTGYLCIAPLPRSRCTSGRACSTP